MENELTLMYLAKKNNSINNNANHNKIDKKYYKKNKKKIYKIIKKLLKNEITSNSLKEAHNLYINEIIKYQKTNEINEKQILQRENNTQDTNNIYNKELIQTMQKSTLDDFVKKVNIKNIKQSNILQ